MKFLTICFFTTTLVLLSDSLKANRGRPNFVFFMADDLGFGDISTFGNKTLITPNIDHMAKDGIRLTHTVVGALVCTPSRAAFLTGRLPIRYGLIGKSVPVLPNLGNGAGLPQSELTFAKVLQQNGYSTALIGKWQLGLNCYWSGDNCHHPNVHGFQYFYGITLSNFRPNIAALIMPSFYTYLTSGVVISCLVAVLLWHRSYQNLSILVALLGLIVPVYLSFHVEVNKRLNSIMMQNDKIIEQPMKLNTLSRRMVRESLNFIQEQNAKKSPFLLFFSFSHVHVPLNVEEKFKNSGSHGIYGDAIREMDWCVGQVMDKIKSLGLRENTVSLFTSDNGAHIQEEGSNYPFSGGKSLVMEGGIRVPTVISWPGHFPANGEVNVPTSLLDIFPTVLSLSGIETPKHVDLDGHDLSQLLAGTNKTSPHKFIIHYGAPNEIYAVRFVENEQSVWKVHFYKQKCYYLCLTAFKLREPLLFNVISDPSESQPIPTDSSKYLEIVIKVKEAIRDHKRQMHVLPPTQLSALNTLWRPWLQPCCNFPYCRCEENKII